MSCLYANIKRADEPLVASLSLVCAIERDESLVMEDFDGFLITENGDKIIFE